MILLRGTTGLGFNIVGGEGGEGGDERTGDGLGEGFGGGGDVRTGGGLGDGGRGAGLGGGGGLAWAFGLQSTSSLSKKPSQSLSFPSLQNLSLSSLNLHKLTLACVSLYDSMRTRSMSIKEFMR